MKKNNNREIENYKYALEVIVDELFCVDFLQITSEYGDGGVYATNNTVVGIRPVITVSTSSIW